jgi:hypothetical protein
MTRVMIARVGVFQVFYIKIIDFITTASAQQSVTDSARLQVAIQIDRRLF